METSKALEDLLHAFLLQISTDRLPVSRRGEEGKAWCFGGPVSLRRAIKALETRRARDAGGWNPQGREGTIGEKGTATDSYTPDNNDQY